MLKKLSEIKNKKPLVLLAFVAAFALARLLLYPYYENNDDCNFADYIAGGCYNMIFMNYFLVRAIGFIQDLIYPHNAYVLIHLFFVLLATFALIDIFRKKYASSKKTAFFALGLIFSVYIISQLYIISFTRLSVYLCLVGYLYLIYYSKEKHWVKGYAVGLLLVIMGAMYRFDGFKAVTAIAAVYYVSLAATDYFESRRSFDNLFKAAKSILSLNLILAVIASTVLCFGLNYASKAINTSTPELEYYCEYTSVRSAVWDYDIPSYDEAKADYDAIGIDANDLRMLFLGFMDDEGAFTLENLKAINAIKEKYNAENRTIKTVLSDMATSAIDDFSEFNKKAVLAIAFFAALLAFVLVNKNGRMLIPAALLLTVFALNMYLSYYGRTPLRAVYPIWMTSTVYLLFSFDKEYVRNNIQKLKPNKSLKLLGVTAVLISYLVIPAVTFFIEDPLPVIDNKYTVELNEYVCDESNSDKKFELNLSADLFDGNMDLPNSYYVKAINSDLNYKLFSCVYYRLPFDDENCRKILGTDNMYTNLVNENVLFPDLDMPKHAHYAPPMKAYLEKWYFPGRTVSYSTVAELEYFTVYDFYLE